MPDFNYDSLAQPPEGTHYPQEDGRHIVGTLQRALFELEEKGAETPEAYAFVQVVSANAALIVERLTARRTTAMPGPLTLGRQMDLLQRADEPLNLQRIGFMEDPLHGVRRDQLRSFLAGHFDAVRLSAAADRGQRQNAAILMMGVFREFVEANPSGIRLDGECDDWLQQIADAYLTVFPAPPEGPRGA